MPEKINFSFQVRQTCIRTIYSDITRLDADAFVSSDDVHLSGASGLSRAIRKAAGPIIQTELRKFALPGPVGGIVLTSGGKLPIKYILHLMTISYGEQPHFETLVPYLIRHVIDICNTLTIERIAIPMLNAGLINLAPTKILQALIQGAACYLATLPATALREITLAVFDDSAADPAAAEAKMLEDIKEVRDSIRAWSEKTTPSNLLLEHLQPLRDAYGSDPTFQASIDQHIQTEERTLAGLFGCADMQAGATALAGAQPRVGGTPSTRAEYERAKSKLTDLLNTLQEDLDGLARVLRQWQQNLRTGQEKEAGFGGHTPIELINDMDTASRKIDYYQQQLEQKQRQRDAVVAQLEDIMRVWEPNAPRPAVTLPDPPPAASDPPPAG